jgi:hypothetical protein
LSFYLPTDYCYGIVCTTITITMVLYARLCVWG